MRLRDVLPPALVRPLVRGKTLAWRLRAALRGGSSQFGQDLWLVRHAFGGRTGGTFVEAGASDGRTGSNTWLLERSYGWTGLCIEANAAFFARLRSARSCACAHACIADVARDVEFLEGGREYAGMVHALSTRHWRTLSTCVPAARYRDAAGNLRVTRMRAVPLAQLLDAHGLPPVIDLLSLDTEGSEADILRTFPFARYRFNVIVVEHYAGPQAKEEIFALLSGSGYVRIRETAYEDFYRHGSFTLSAA